MFFSSKDMVLSHAQNFVAIQSTSYKVLTQHMVETIRCVNGDERQRTDFIARKGPDGCQWTEGVRWIDIDEHRIEVDGRWIELQ